MFSYIAGSWRILGDRMSLWVARSADSGRTWTEPARVFTGGAAIARDNVVAALATGELQAAWLVSGPDSTPDRLFVARSADSGRTWRRVTSTVAGDPFRAMLFIGRSGTVDGFTFFPLPGHWETEHLRWAGGVWRECRVPRIDSLAYSRAGSDGARYRLALTSRQTTKGGPLILATWLTTFSVPH